MFKEHHLPTEYFYRPQTKFAKVMFLQVSVCPQGGSVSTGGLCPDGSLFRGSLSKGFSVQEGLCPGESLSREGLCPGKPSIQ